ncbi:ABC transporter ATP-binding protein [Clostridiaceae bacterium HFYG-1003]|nr:ABC transporter ATP-binding protein [Clostridiaceae bacterium HFYG-1003]
MINISNVTKRYQRTPALVDATLTLAPGKVIGLLGPNGSGKTTLLRILTGELRADGGTIELDGQPLSHQSKARISALTRTDFMPEGMTIAQASETYRSMFQDFDEEKFLRLIQELDLKPTLRIDRLSKGMKSKFALALAVSRRARLIVLDEPLEGVDPVAREEILDLIAAGFSPESTILVTSHLIHELERLLDEVYFIRDGQVRAMGDVEAIRADRQVSLDELYREVYRK